MGLKLPLVLVLCLAIGWTPATAQGVVTGAPPQGPIERSLAREAARLAWHVQAGQAPTSAPWRADLPVELKWGELGPLVVGQRVDVTLSDERVVRGEALAVRETELLVKTRKGEKPTMTLARDSVKALTVYRLRGSGWRAFGTTMGVLSGMWIAGAAAFATDSEAMGWLVFLGGTTGFGVLGYHAGKQGDTDKMRITIVP